MIGVSDLYAEICVKVFGNRRFLVIISYEYYKLMPYVETY